MHILWSGPATGPTVVLAHSAGAPMDSAWMTTICTRLGERGIRTARFEFPYMAGRRQGVRRPPPKAELSMGDYRDAVAAIERAADAPLIIGGKSYGGRIASMIADELHDAGRVAGLVCLGYPFHPPQRPEQLRTAHLLTLRTPALICQGRRDPFGGVDEVDRYGLSASIEVRWFDGAHDVQTPARLSGVADAIAEFADQASSRSIHP